MSAVVNDVDYIAERVEVHFRNGEVLCVKPRDMREEVLVGVLCEVASGLRRAGDGAKAWHDSTADAIERMAAE